MNKIQQQTHTTTRLPVTKLKRQQYRPQIKLEGHRRRPSLGSKLLERLHPILLVGELGYHIIVYSSSIVVQPAALPFGPAGRQVWDQEWDYSGQEWGSVEEGDVVVTIVGLSLHRSQNRLIGMKDRPCSTHGILFFYPVNHITTLLQD